MTKIERLAQEFGWSVAQARRAVKAARKLIRVVDKALARDPFDRRIEEMTDEDIRSLRTAFAEEGTELTPDEMSALVDIVREVRVWRRGEE